MGLNFDVPLFSREPLPYRVYTMSARTNKLAYLLDTVTYKPGWKLQAMDGPNSFSWPETVLMISFTAIDPVKGSTGEFGRTWILPESLDFMKDDRAILKFIEYCIIELEVHEVHEFLRVDGVPVTDPHPKKA